MELSAMPGTRILLAGPQRHRGGSLSENTAKPLEKEEVGKILGRKRDPAAGSKRDGRAAAVADDVIHLYQDGNQPWEADIHSFSGRIAG